MNSYLNMILYNDVFVDYDYDSVEYTDFDKKKKKNNCQDFKNSVHLLVYSSFNCGALPIGYLY